MDRRPPSPEQIENRQLARLIEQNDIQIAQNIQIMKLLQVLAKEEAPPALTKIQIQFVLEGDSMLVAGPITLTSVGQKATAGVLGFDQNGNAMPAGFTMPQASFSADDAGVVVSFDPVTGITSAVANGVSNITAKLTTAEGLNLSDTESVTVAIPVVPPPPPVLTTIKVGFDSGTAATLAAAFKKN
jgi:hypothetical protein